MSQSNQPTVVATVVTFNRSALLDRSLQAIKKQSRLPDAIVVVDNNSSDDTPQLMADKYPDVVYLRLSDNTGSGGGQHAALQYGQDKGFDYIWTMDDDGVAQPDALKLLLQNTAAAPSGILNSLVLADDDEKDDRLSFPIFLGRQEVRRRQDINVPVVSNWISPFNSTLIHKSVIERIGLPRSELFIWGDEMEYLYRARSRRIPMAIVCQSLIKHPASASIWQGDIPLPQFWKVYYMIRNLRYYQAHKYGAVWWWPINVASFLHYCRLILTTQKTARWQKIKLAFLSYWHGLTGRLNWRKSDVDRLCA